MAEPVTLTADGGVLVITLDRPKANAIDVATSNALYQAFARLADDPRLRVGIVTGAGQRFFSAGWDLKAAARRSTPTTVRAGSPGSPSTSPSTSR